MYTLTRYLEIIVDPTWEEFRSNSTSVRHAFLTCAAISHSVDRAAEEQRKRPATVRKEWSNENIDFHLVDIVANHRAHVKSNAERQYDPSKPAIPIGRALGFGDFGEELDLRNIYYLIRDAIMFVHKKAGTEHPDLPL